MRLAGLIAAAVLLTAAYPVPPREQRGRQDADCRPNEPGPALRVTVQGLKDRRGVLRMELYPADDDDFLAPDKVLIAAGKVFKRVETRVPPQGDPVLCIRAPRTGTFAIAILHDRDGNGRFGVFSDGVSTPGAIPRIGRSRPRASYAAIAIGPGVTTARATMQYLTGLGGFGPLR